ncbi:DUF397 domain-containing protein [Streptomyces sp. NPDC052676]|uniref:DUF397 domain-containing protein n=1 Tax=Streptomyces sp. NPDC052676 TaxID=3154953 RepID=UPI00342439D9
MRIVDLSAASWRKSSYSNQDGGACLEVSDDFDALVPVRDSKHIAGPVIIFPATGWASFVSALQRGELSA